MGILVFRAGQRLRFSYENYRGETSIREVEFVGLDYGNNEWYTERQWFMRTFDFGKNAARSFALAKIDADRVEVIA